jgi:hypothetical protein
MDENRYTIITSAAIYYAIMHTVLQKLYSLYCTVGEKCWNWLNDYRDGLAYALNANQLEGGGGGAKKKKKTMW